MSQAAEQPGMDDWAKALEELERIERRKEARLRLATPKPVRETPLPTELEEEAAVRVPHEPKTIEQMEEICCDTSESTGTPMPDEMITPIPSEETPAPVRTSRMSRYEELCKKPSITVKTTDLQVMDELSEILCSVNTALHKLQAFGQDYKDAVPAHKYKHWEENLKDTASIMMHEFHALRNGKAKKCYDKRQICSKCHSVFMVPLPEGICDECRSHMTSTGGEY